MRYSSALVLGALAVGQATAANIRHANFHARRDAEKRGAYDNVNWARVVYDLSGVDWSSVFASSVPTPTPTPAAAQPSVAKANVAAEPTSDATPAYTPPTSSPAAEQPAPSSASSHSSGVSAVLTGLSSIKTKFGVTKWQTGWNDDSNNGHMWFGADSNWQVTFKNGHSQSIDLWCWDKDLSSGGTVIANQPIITTTLGQGDSTTLSWAGGAGSACAAIYPDTQPSPWGGIFNTYFEVTFKNESDIYSVGTFDVSYEPNMSGTAITAVGSQCTSDATTCVFKCTNGQPYCGDANTYQLHNCDKSIGGGGDDAMVNGGCNTANDAEHIQVTFH